MRGAIYHVSQPYSNVDLTLELKNLNLMRFDMLDDFQTELGWAKALRGLLMRLATLAYEPLDLSIILLT